MTPFAPITHEGKDYPMLSVSLSTAPVIKGNDYTTGVNIVFTPMRLDEDTNTLELLQSHAKVVLFDDIVGKGGPAELQTFMAINTALQNYVNVKKI